MSDATSSGPVTAHAVFDVGAYAARLPETCDTMVADHRFTDDPAASARVFRVYHPTPPHSHASCDEYLYALSGRCLMQLADAPPVEVGPGMLVFFKRNVVHAVPEILEHPMVFLSVDTPRREPRDIRFVEAGTGTPDSFIRQSEG
ncbi:cupin domain-containing protein [Methylobacterium sp. BTF04]|uniref:cupin domain-containing protein n=1 Tax=Methylobacterium sp. BTF04 TaxID=2708300 RepID=UPI0013D38B8F|nr:cupin domain-containing protein [Methylobacterium sp. BTF04]NEU14050.1 cupin domain-containing protein [Methylobacterium sp. BTF04]